MNRLLLTNIFVLCLSSTFGCSQPNDSTLHVYAASSLRDVFHDLESSFESQHPGVDVVINYAGSQTLRLQIEHGAPADIFASANAEHMNQLITNKMVERAHVLAHNRLVIIVPTRGPSPVTNSQTLVSAHRLVIGWQLVDVVCSLW